MRFVGLVRNVMLGREGLHRNVLLALLDAAGGRSGVSCPTTGNLVFDAAPAQLDAVVQRLEAGIAAVIGRREPVVVREAAWLSDFVAGDPFAGSRSIAGSSRSRSCPCARRLSIPARCHESTDSRRSPSGRTSCSWPAGATSGGRP